MEFDQRDRKRYARSIETRKKRKKGCCSKVCCSIALAVLAAVAFALYFIVGWGLGYSGLGGLVSKSVANLKHQAGEATRVTWRVLRPQTKEFDGGKSTPNIRYGHTVTR
jgi:hypothetical protein